MSRHFARLASAAVLVASAFVVSSPAASAAGGSYTIDDIAQDAIQGTTDYGSSYGNWAGKQSDVGDFDINDSGWVAGTSDTYVGSGRAFLWKGPGQYTDIGTLNKGAGIGRAYTITANGTIIGFAGAKKNDHAFKYLNGTMTDLGSLTSSGYSVGWDMAGGLVVGGASASTGYEHAFKFDSSMHDIGTLGTAWNISEARAVNSSGTIVGRTWGSAGFGGASLGFKYTGSAMTALPTFGGGQGEADDINDAGQVVGTASLPDGRYHAFLLSGSTMIDLTPSASSAIALGINSKGEVVGEADGRAFLYSNGQYFDLTSQLDPSLGWSLVTAWHINASGQIVATGTHNGVWRVARLTLTSAGANAHLLATFEPEWRYSSTEPYRPTSAQLAVDTVSTNPVYHENTLRVGPLSSSIGPPVLAADPNDPNYPKMTLASLGPAVDQDVIDENNDLPGYAPSQVAQSDYQSMVSTHPGVYNDQVYGRVVVDGSETYLQYWVYYYFNQKTTEFTIGEHEGDWEMVTVHLETATLTPSWITYAQHEGGETCPWGINSAAGNHTIVWVADGSHASYFLPGSHAIWADSAGGGIVQIGTDYTASANSYFADTPAVVDVSTPPSWITWSGWWGSSSGVVLLGEDKSPKSPGAQPSWDPVYFEGHSNDCGSEGAGTNAALKFAPHQSTLGSARAASAPKRESPTVYQRPALPYRIHAHMEGRNIAVSYCFRSITGTKYNRPWSIYSTVDDPSDKLTVMTDRWPIKQRCGSFTQPTYPFKPPYRLSIYVSSPIGYRSPHLAVPIN